MKNIKMRFILSALMTLFFVNSYAQTMVWSDEFNGTEIDKTVWSHQCGIWGFGNYEYQCYTDLPTNSRIENGTLVMEARRESKEGKNFTSSRLTTLGKFAFKYGSIEARIKLPDVSRGLWPAFWLMGINIGKDGWPKCGETDIMEVGSKTAWVAGHANTEVSGAVHWYANGQADYGTVKNYPATPFNTAFHTYRLDWTPTTMTMTFDGDQYYTVSLNATMEEFQNPQYILLNLAVGGVNFAQTTSEADITAPFPAKMEVDYIRLYSNSDTQIYSPTSSNPYGVAETGDFGVFTETHPCTTELDYSADAVVNVWNGLTTGTSTAAEGSKVLNFTTQNGQWFGMGIMTSDHNMNNYRNGTLHFKMKVASGLTEDIRFGVESTINGGGVPGAGGTDNCWVTLNATNNYGLIRDGQWHDVNIPLNLMPDVDFTFVKHLFRMVAENPGGNYALAIDDIYWIPSVELNKPSVGTLAIYSETVATTNSRVAIGTDARVDIWGGNTLVAATTTPAEGTYSLSFTGGNQGWWGLALGAINKYDLSAFRYSDCNLSFKVKSTSTALFTVGLKSGSEYYKGIRYINISNASGPYDFARDGQWHTIIIPLSEFYTTSDFSNIGALFVALGTTNISNIAFDDIYLTNGHVYVPPVTTELPQKINTPSVELYPNPVANELTVASSNAGFNAYQITTLAGIMVNNGALDNNLSLQSINTASLAKGLYFITLLGDAQKITRKIMKL